MQKTRFIWIVFVLAGLLAFMPALALAQGDGDGQKTIEHTVKAGENLFRIANQYNTTVFAIAKENNITNPNLIIVGTVLRIPVTEAGTATPAPTGTTIPTAEAVASATPSPTPAATTEPAEELVYVVKPQDNLFRIAIMLGTTVRALVEANPEITNPNLIYVGQVLRLPADVKIDADGSPTQPTSTPSPAESASATPLPTAANIGDQATPTSADTTQVETTPGDSGQQPTVPVAPTISIGGPTLTINTPIPVIVVTTPPGPVATEEVTEPATPEIQPTSPESPSSGSAAVSIGFAYGLEVNLLSAPDRVGMINRARELGVTWIKQEVSWAEIEPENNVFVLEVLDEIVQLAEANGLNLMLTITDAPDWARSVTTDAGPPANNADFADALNTLTIRYKDAVDAWEIWHEPNLAVNWNGGVLGGANYVELLRVAYEVIKSNDPNAVVVSAGLAPTGPRDGAIDDRTFLRQMYENGLKQFSDAIGAQPFGWANPPDSVCCRNNPDVQGWDDHPSFFFLNTLQDYRNIMNEFDDSGKFIWATQFGWGSADGVGATPPPALEFLVFSDQQEQADYTVRAYKKGLDLGYVGPMFAWNLNFCPLTGAGSTECYWSFLNPVGDPRAVYFSLRDTPK
jgi:LysM repeat protein